MPAYPGPGQVIANSDNPNYCLWMDPDTTGIWEFRYMTHVTEPESLMYRPYSAISRPWQSWPDIWPETCEPVPAIMEFFHGPLIGEKDDPNVIEQLELAVAMVRVALSNPTTDSKVLDDLAEFMNGRQFDSDDWSTIMDLVRQTGREVNDVEQ
jgi:hypothetical protein